MKKVVFTVQDDVCLKNNKDPNAVELFAVLPHYGIVEDYDRHIANLKADYQKALDSMTAQYNAIKEQELTADEILLVRTYRDNKQTIVTEYVAKNDELANELQAIKSANEIRNAQIKALLEK